jgi:uncharacterized protein
MHLAEIWRYPVKSMAGERLERADLTLDGIAGDRVLLVRDARGRVVTARTRPLLLGHRALLEADGEPSVDGKSWHSPRIAQAVEAAAGQGARLVRSDPENRFDVLPLLVATDGAIVAFGHDGRRLRPNLVIAGVEGLAERGWEGQQLRVGDALVGVEDLRRRCVMTTFDPDTLDQDVGVLRGIQRDFDGVLALNCFVIRPARIAVGDPVELHRVLRTQDAER